jgi:hypothetical protein
MTVWFQLPMISVPAGFVQSTPTLPSKTDTSAGSSTLPRTRARVGGASGYASQTAVKRLPLAE